jgi:hypothetical protein
LQGGYDGTHFLSNVEVYNPIDDVWEDGVPLTSGRSGLASAVIYQPSCPQTYSQDSLIVQHSANREYDDDTGKSSDHQGNGGGSSINFSYSCNVNQRGSGGQGSGLRDQSDQSNCDDNDVDDVDGEEQSPAKKEKELFRLFSRMHSRLKCNGGESRKDKLNHPSNHEHQSKYSGIIKTNSKCKANPCPIQRLTQKIHHFVSNRRKQCDYQRRLKGNDEN